MDDLISRQAAQTELMMKCERYTLAKESHGMGRVEWSSDLISVEDAMNAIRWLPPAQPTLYGYNMEHLALIAEVLRKENLPPERVAEALTDVGRIVSMVRAECEEEFRKAVERCMI